MLIKYLMQPVEQAMVQPRSQWVMRLIKIALLLSVCCFGTVAQAERAYVTDGGDKLHVIDTSNNQVISSITVGEESLGVAINPSSTRVYVANCGSNSVSVIDTAINQVIATVPVEVCPTQLVVNPTDTFVYVTHDGSNTVSVINTQTHSVTSIATSTTPEKPMGMSEGITINATGTRVYVAQSKTIIVIDTSTNQVRDTINMERQPNGVAVNPSGTRLYVSGGELTVIDITNDANRVVSVVPVWLSPYGVVVNPAGTLVYVSSRWSNSISIIDTDTNKIISTISSGTLLSYNVATNPSGTRIYVTSGDGNVSIIDTGINREIANITLGDVTYGVVIGTVPCSTTTEVPVAECQELMNLYHSTNGINWKDKTGWNQNDTPCRWTGITCSGGHITGIQLTNNKLSGLLPNLNLSNLQSLELNTNGLSGNVPNFGNLPNLQSLSLSDNQLSGRIPNFSNLPNLQSLDVGGNQLSGSIPDFSNLPNLQSLSLWRNQLSGNIPNFGKLPALKSISLSRNQLTGSIPSFSNLGNLKSISLGLNYLSGVIPNLPMSNFEYFTIGYNCGLVAYDAAQEAILNQKDRNWKTRNPSCPAESAKCEDPAKHAKYSVATGRVSIPFTDLPTLKTDSPESTGGMAVFKNLRLQFVANQDFKVIASSVTPDTSKEVVGDPCHAVYTYATRTLKIPKVEVPSITGTFPAIIEGKPIEIYEVTLQHIETNPVDLGIVQIKESKLIETIQ